MKKKTFILSCLTLAVFPLTSCGGDKPSDNSSSGSTDSYDASSKVSNDVSSNTVDEDSDFHF